jgi:hypothetical protein
VALAVLVGIATLGPLLVDQVRSKLLASDEFGNYRLLPTPVAHWALTWMLGAGPPTLDAMLLVIVLCVVGLAGNIAKMRTPPDFDEIRTSVIYGAVGIVAAGGLAAVSASSRLRDTHNRS